jgi:hypothetical protein
VVAITLVRADFAHNADVIISIAVAGGASDLNFAASISSRMIATKYINTTLQGLRRD